MYAFLMYGYNMGVVGTYYHRSLNSSIPPTNISPRTV